MRPWGWGARNCQSSGRPGGVRHEGVGGSEQRQAGDEAGRGEAGVRGPSNGRQGMRQEGEEGYTAMAGREG